MNEPSVILYKNMWCDSKQLNKLTDCHGHTNSPVICLCRIWVETSIKNYILSFLWCSKRQLLLQNVILIERWSLSNLGGHWFCLGTSLGFKIPQSQQDERRDCKNNNITRNIVRIVTWWETLALHLKCADIARWRIAHNAVAAFALISAKFSIRTESKSVNDFFAYFCISIWADSMKLTHVVYL